MTSAEARFNKSLRPRKPEGSLGRTAQDVHLDSHTAPELCLKCTTLLISSGLVLYSIYWCTTLYSSLLGWYFLKCTTLYSSLLGRYCTVFTDMYYTLLISSGLVLYSIYFSFPRRVMHVHSARRHFETCNFRQFDTHVTDVKTDKGTLNWTKGITESVRN